MIAPMLRLLAIYLAVGLAVFGFFKRDAIMSMFTGNDDVVASVTTPTAPPATPPAPPEVLTVQPVPSASQAVPQAPVYAPLPGEAAASTQAATIQMPRAAAATPLVATPTAPPAAPVPAATVEVADEMAYLQGLEAARRAYWQGDIQGAIAHYIALLAQFPDDENLHGELGNIYFMRGQRREAAWHFEQSGMAAIAAGRAAQAHMLAGILRGFDSEAAARLTAAMRAGQ